MSMCLFLKWLWLVGVLCLSICLRNYIFFEGIGGMFNRFSSCSWLKEKEF